MYEYITWEKTTHDAFAEGDLIRAYKGSFTRVEGKVEIDDEGDFYAPGVGYLSNTYQEDEFKFEGWDYLEKGTVMVRFPNDVGTILGVRFSGYSPYSQSMYVRDRGGWWLKTTSGAASSAETSDQELAEYLVDNYQEPVLLVVAPVGPDTIELHNKRKV